MLFQCFSMLFECFSMCSQSGVPMRVATDRLKVLSFTMFLAGGVAIDTSARGHGYVKSTEFYNGFRGRRGHRRRSDPAWPRLRVPTGTSLQNLGFAAFEQQNARTASLDAHPHAQNAISRDHL